MICPLLRRDIEGGVRTILQHFGKGHSILKLSHAKMSIKTNTTDPAVAWPCVLPCVEAYAAGTLALFRPLSTR